MLQREKSSPRRAASCSSGPAHRRDSQQARIGAGITSVAQEMGDFVPQRRESAPVRGLAEIEMIDDPRLVGDGGGHARVLKETGGEEVQSWPFAMASSQNRCGPPSSTKAS